MTWWRVSRYHMSMGCVGSICGTFIPRCTVFLRAMSFAHRFSAPTPIWLRSFTGAMHSTNLSSRVSPSISSRLLASLMVAAKLQRKWAPSTLLSSWKRLSMREKGSSGIWEAKASTCSNVGKSPARSEATSSSARHSSRYGTSVGSRHVAKPWGKSLLRRPARPAICFTCVTGMASFSTPLNFCMVLKITRRILRFRPIPTASEATSTSSPDTESLKSFACWRRVSGGSAP
mmetsp:Transcript_7886/g.26326  ORF Transcript_7886/g.26326 Transcript_7886/m.26326 type:complete len:231 (-) Transcript_7886:1285-1977(-)